MTANWPMAGLRALASALPWEYRLRRVGWDASAARWRMEAATAARADLPRLGLLMSAGVGTCEDWCRTLATWALQTAPVAGWWVVGSNQEPWQAERIAAGLPAPVACIAEITDAELLAAAGADWALTAHAGDLLHPSLAWITATAAADGKLAVGWDWLEYADTKARFELTSRVRAPWRDMVRELHVDVRGRAFALPVAGWEGFPSVSAWQLRIGQSPDIDASIQLHPEPLAMYRQTNAGGDACDPAHLQGAAASYWGEPFTACVDAGLAPAAAAPSVSVVLMYRDRPMLTIAAIRSVLAQRFSGELEVVLVDNASTPDTVAVIEQALAEAVTSVKVTWLSAPGPFNHSAQAAQAAQAARGEVLLFLNNDARLLQADAIDRMARWARLPNIASVGVAVVDADASVIGGGMRARLMPGAAFNSPVEEACGEDAAHARQVIGNSFACAAVSAVAWRALNGLDALRFPAGYNDVDYCLRAVSRGWMHVNLGQVHISHQVGASRPKQDEIAQKTRLRSDYPWVAVNALGEFAREPLNLTVSDFPRLTNRPAGAWIETRERA